MCGSDDKAVISTLNIVSNWSEHGGLDNKRDEVRIFSYFPLLCPFFPCVTNSLFLYTIFNVLIFPTENWQSLGRFCSRVGVGFAKSSKSKYIHVKKGSFYSS